MKKTLVPGVTGESRHRVVTENLVSHRLPGMPAVLSSPALLFVMETAAYEAIRPHLDPGEASVGIRFDFEHLAPTPCGETVTATARVTAVDGRQITLDFAAHDGREEVARGTHIRAVIDLKGFRDRLQQRGT